MVRGVLEVIRGVLGAIRKKGTHLNVLIILAIHAE